MNQTEKPTEIGQTEASENTETNAPKKKQPKAHCATCGIMQIEHTSQSHSFVPRPKGFAAMSRERVQEIASKGGKAAHAQGTAHQFTHDEAVEAGRKGGKARTEKHGPVGIRSSVEPDKS